MEKRQGFTSVGDLEGCVHYKVGKYTRNKNGNFYPFFSKAKKHIGYKYCLCALWELHVEYVRFLQAPYLPNCCCFLVRYEKIKFLVIALKNAVEVYAWAPKPYHKFMAFKVGNK